MQRPWALGVAMKWWQGSRRVLKWCSVLFFLLMGIVWAISLNWECTYWASAVGVNSWGVGVNSGQVFFVSKRNPQPLRNTFMLIALNDKRPFSWDHPLASLPFYSNRSIAFWFLPHFPHWNGIFGGLHSYRMVIVPIPLILLLGIILTMIVVWRDRKRIPSNCCQGCGYNLTGNTSGICPECGVQIGDQSTTKV